jgi:hypothetical protein
MYLSEISQFLKTNHIKAAPKLQAKPFVLHTAINNISNLAVCYIRFKLSDSLQNRNLTTTARTNYN